MLYSVFNPNIYQGLLMGHLESINMYADRILSEDLFSLDLSAETEKTFFLEFIRRDEVNNR